VFQPIFRSNVFPVAVVLMAVSLSACNGDSVVKESSPQPATAVSAQSTPAAPQPSAEVKSTPTPTPHPAMKQAQAQPGVPVAVPESVRRPLNAEEMQKALQQLPPEVRQRIMGMQQLPTPSPQPAKK
jgi:hypothetical protein